MNYPQSVVKMGEAGLFQSHLSATANSMPCPSKAGRQAGC